MGSNSSKISEQDKAILQLKMQRDELSKAQRRMQDVANKETSIAKQCLARGDKERAKLALKRKKFQQKQLTKIDEQLTTLTELASSIEFAVVQRDVLKGLQQGNEALKAINKEMPIERAEKILDESKEGIAYQEELSARLAENMTDIDMDEIEAELEKLQSQKAAESLPKMPNVPAHKVEQDNQAVEEDEGQEIAEGSGRQAVLA